MSGIPTIWNDPIKPCLSCGAMPEAALAGFPLHGAGCALAMRRGNADALLSLLRGAGLSDEEILGMLEGLADVQAGRTKTLEQIRADFKVRKGTR